MWESQSAKIILLFTGVHEGSRSPPAGVHEGSRHFSWFLGCRSFAPLLTAGNKHMRGLSGDVWLVAGRLQLLWLEKQQLVSFRKRQQRALLVPVLGPAEGLLLPDSL
ncbi:hypothetical protein Cadr_000017681 [Camelus dromedarius]|uniref:Uncharacterized protein n=1 Tax=Camelus dromedarius TaxID=9838 RepID=A0A5N4D853_CAMDR|nr:hypothetical protein Cadr_000017681 [Camelus dromedarius]